MSSEEIAEVAKVAVEVHEQALANAAQVAPLHYLLLVFLGLVVLAVLVTVVWIFTSGRKSQSEQMTTMQKMQQACHANATANMKTATEATTNCREVVAENTVVLRGVQARLEASQ